MNEFLSLCKRINASAPNSIQLLSEKPERILQPHEVISSGSLAMDVASGIGGWPRNRVVEVFGNESSGKTTLATMACAEFNKIGLYAAYVDVEHAFDVRYGVALGIKPDLFTLSQPNCAEEALEIVLDAAATKECGIVVIDSVAGLVTRQELEGDLDDHNISATARLMGKTLRKLIAVCSVNSTLAMFINQNRDKIGVMFGSPKTQPGGRALKFFSSMRVEFARIATEKDKQQNNEAISNKTQASFIKNKVGPPYRTCEFDIVFGKGINNQKSAVELGVKTGLIEKKGNTYSYQGEIIGIGVNKAAEALAAEEELYEKIRRRVLKRSLKEAPKITEEKKVKTPKPILQKQSKTREVSVTETRSARLLDV